MTETGIPTGHDMTFTPEAKIVITAMRDKCSEIGFAYGESSPEYTKTVRSLAYSITSMIGLGGHVAADGELSLICFNEYLTYGVNFSRSDNTWSVNS